MSARRDQGGEMVVRLRRICEAFDPDIGGHLDHVADYCVSIGEALGLTAGQVAELALAAPLHDLGKIGVPAEVQHKAGPLTPAERAVMEGHTVIGHRLLDGSDSPVLQLAARMALAHHENWDGSGYPNRWRGRQIPLEARILAVADVFDALLSRRCYKEAWEGDQVLEEMRRLRGTKFDPEILDVFLAHLPQTVRFGH